MSKNYQEKMKAQADLCLFVRISLKQVRRYMVKTYKNLKNQGTEPGSEA